MKHNRSKLNALVGALGAVFGMGAYVGNLYSNNIATFGMMAIFILGFAIVHLMTKEGS